MPEKKCQNIYSDVSLTLSMQNKLLHKNVLGYRMPYQILIIEASKLLFISVGHGQSNSVSNARARLFFITCILVMGR